jgi:transcriptional regulator with XRE-family HTH domain
MDSPRELLRAVRLEAGLSQRGLARRAGTSQPAIARYERGASTPSWETLQRLVAACGQRVRLEAEREPDPDDVELLLELTPIERLPALPICATSRGSDFVGWKSRRFNTDAGPLDIVPQAAAIGGFDEVATVELTLGDISVRVLTIDEVIASKEALDRPKDRAALPALIATRKAIRLRRGAG